MTAIAATTPSSFLDDVSAAEERTPLPPPPPPMPDPASPEYIADPEALEAARQAAQAAAAAFAEGARRRGEVVGQVVSTWLATAPLDMLQQLLDQPGDVMPIFRPAIGPVVVARHGHVLACLSRPDVFTVDLYAPEMARATDDRTRHPDAFAHFLLGTDDDDLYRIDDVLLRRAVSPADEPLLTRLARAEAENWARHAAGSPGGEVDVVPTLARSVPLRIVGDYLGVPPARTGEPSVLPGRCGGDPFPLDEAILDVFSFHRISDGRVPTAEDLFGWVKDVFRNTFNNFDPAAPGFAEFRERGVVATEYLTAYVHALLVVHKRRLRCGEPVPDTLLTRLLRFQLALGGAEEEALAGDVAALLGAPLPDGELARRLSDSMIRSNVFGVVVGAVVNPQEATCRVVDGMLRLKDHEYVAHAGSTYDEAVRLAGLEAGDPGYEAGLRTLRTYALEALRLRPQGEVLLRLCSAEGAELGGLPIRRGTPVFVGYAGAMRDPCAVPDPLGFDVTRDQALVGYLQDAERACEAPQSGLYLQHGYGRHKCLGRYASEVTLQESLRALLRLGGLERRSELELDEQNLYARSLRIAVAGGAR
jgi:cytochrome P450